MLAHYIIALMPNCYASSAPLDVVCDGLRTSLLMGAAVSRDILDMAPSPPMQRIESIQVPRGGLGE